VKEQTVKRTVVFIAALAVIATAVPRVAIAQEKQLVPLKVQLVISRTAGEKKVTSLPYAIWVTANDKQTTRVRMGVEVPVTTTVFATKESTQPTTTWTYRSVGTNIDCQVNTVPDGRFSMNITLNDSSIDRDAGGKGPAAGIPVIRNFTSNFAILLRDGQTATYTSATDPVSGETLKVDVTLTVLK
jgi:hypothetical protein